MKLLLLRTTQADNIITGTLSIDEKYICDTLELADIVPMGWYQLQLTYSPKFQRMLPILRYVPGHTGIRIHAGNTVNDTSGCILVGTLDHKCPRLLRSRQAEQKIVELLKALPHYEECYLEIATPRYRAAELECMCSAA